MKEATRETYLSQSKTPPVSVVIDDVQHYLRRLSIRERDGVEQTATEWKNGGKVSFRAALLVRCICDKDGVRLLGDDQARALGNEEYSDTLTQLFDHACRLNNFTEEEKEELEKN